MNEDTGDAGDRRMQMCDDMIVWNDIDGWEEEVLADLSEEWEIFRYGRRSLAETASTITILLRLDLRLNQQH